MTQTPQTSQTSQTELIYERLRQSILSLAVTPGARLTERGLEAELAASRTPVRAALTRLEGEGLMQRDGRGWRVSPIDLGEVEAQLEFRSAVEAAAVRLAALRATDAQIDALDDLLLSFDPPESEEAGHRMGTDFHVELVRLSGNPFMVASAVSSLTRLARTRWLEVRTRESRVRAIDEHRAIVEALRRRAGDEAARLVVAHIERTRERLVLSLDEERSRSLRARGYEVIAPGR
ncbi:GntR family transcriptional regulator [Subtercola sp. Z020]|uniref:GntR family transcriptional regulator n=1 Tax=Subtercola sp. Z020 TaxID=2080582 RepID=UPI000CE9057B|nr:GntR family transcriptional regulator [Subtercola sp. Z020]PPF77930.1 GntR family transcriptional regulator [Subtercola sp. Z020]